MADLENIYTAHKTAIICAATAAAGPNATEADIVDRIKTILSLHTPGSPADSAVQSVERRAESVGEVKTFTGTVIHVDKETSSERGIVVTKGGSKLPGIVAVGGQEVSRSERLDSAEAGASARELMNSLSGLVGHKVVLSVGVAKRDGTNYRTLVGVEDRGADQQYMAGLDANGNQQNPEFRLNPGVNRGDFSKWAVASQL